MSAAARLRDRLRPGRDADHEARGQLVLFPGAHDAAPAEAAKGKGGLHSGPPRNRRRSVHRAGLARVVREAVRTRGELAATRAELTALRADVAALCSATRAAPAAALPGIEYVDADEAAGRLGISREGLDAMRKRAPPTLPGAPVQVGQGSKRRHWRWEAARLAEWFAAVGAWDAERAEAARARNRSGAARPATPRPAKAPKGGAPAAPPVDYAAIAREFRAQAKAKRDKR